jgi:hypothetical protein
MYRTPIKEEMKESSFAVGKFSNTQQIKSNASEEEQ